LRKNRWLAVAVGIALLGLLLTGCTETQTTAGDWEGEIGKLETAIESIREMVLSNTAVIQELQQKTGSLEVMDSSENPQAGNSEDIARLDNSLASLQRSFDALSARLDEIEASLSDRPSGSSRPSGGRP
jgi:chromosome segregation ATPase